MSDLTEHEYTLRMTTRVAHKVSTAIKRYARKYRRAFETGTFVPEPGRVNANELWMTELEKVRAQLDAQIGLTDDPRPDPAAPENIMRGRD